MIDPEALKLIPSVGSAKIMPPIVVTTQDGQKVMIPQVAVAIASDEVMAKVAAYTTKFVIDEMVKLLQAAGLLPTSQEPQSVVQSTEPAPAGEETREEEDGNSSGA